MPPQLEGPSDAVMLDAASELEMMLSSGSAASECRLQVWVGSRQAAELCQMPAHQRHCIICAHNKRLVAEAPHLDPAGVGSAGGKVPPDDVMHLEDG